ncbi:MAG: hypothetical protein KDA61_07485, partial [Planctomycetales bacterium]|nr:hypothetical protein [Planctomycetales bacterium]
MNSHWDEVYLARHHATSGYRAGEYEVYTPTGRTGGTLRYAVYGFKAYLDEALQFGALKEGMAARPTWHGACVKTGTWSTTGNNSVAGGTSAYSKEPGATISGDATGHALVLRTMRSTNGGMAIVSIDGDPYAANRLEAV